MRWSSTLLAASTTGFLDARRIFTTASSASVMPMVASTTNSTASARLTAISAWARIASARPRASGSQPPVSTTVKARPFQVASYVDAVARDAGDVLDDRLAAADDAVDQRGLADVRAADDGEHRHRSGRVRGLPRGLVRGPLVLGGSVSHRRFSLVGHRARRGRRSTRWIGNGPGQVEPGLGARPIEVGEQLPVQEHRGVPRLVPGSAATGAAGRARARRTRSRCGRRGAAARSGRRRAGGCRS